MVSCNFVRVALEGENLEVVVPEAFEVEYPRDP